MKSSNTSYIRGMSAADGLADATRARHFRAPGLTVSIGEDPRSGLIDARLDILSDGKPCCPPIAIRLVPAAQATEALAVPGATPVLHFPGAARHPAGTDAGVSWFNDLGEGWLRIIRPGQAIILIPLQGWERQAETLIVPTRGLRGPPKSMDLWLSIAALLKPFGTDGVELQALTGINRFNVYDWLARSTAAGMLVRLAGWSGRRDRFIMPPAQIALHGEYIRNAWGDWRHGRATARLRPLIRFFVASSEWPMLAKLSDDKIVPTGVTWLEGQGGGRPLLTPAGSIPRLAFLCRAADWERLVDAAQLTPRTQRERPYDSESIILADDHPLWSIMLARQLQDTHALAWPAGLRALDALHDPEPRVRDVAEAAWKDWLGQHRIHVENHQGAVS